MSGSTFYHLPVLKDEAIAALDIHREGIYVDATFGGGGHSRAILEQLSGAGRLIAFDQDVAAAGNAPEDERFTLINENFRYLKKFLKLHQSPSVDGVLADLGVSSFQFDTAERGFSTRFDGILDMRMDTRQQLMAKDIVQQYDEPALQLLFEKYGEVRNSKTLANTIFEGRKHKEVVTINDFKALITPCIKGNPNRYLAQVFQALRIKVNDELGSLQSFLEQSASCLKTSGRLCVITFHSLEDRLVKRFLKSGNFSGDVETDVFGKPITDTPFNALKSVLPGTEEIKNNARSRSARLRIAEKK